MERVQSEILDNLDAIVYVADMKTYEVLYANRHARDIFGDIIGRLCWQVLQANQTGPCNFCTNSKLLSPEGTPTGLYHWEFLNTVNNRWYDVRDRAIRWIDGRIVRLEIATDITKSKAIQEELISARNLWEKTFDSIPEIVMLIDANYRIVRANSAMARKLGTEREQLLGKLCYEVFHASNEPYSFCPHNLASADGLQHSAEIFSEKLESHYIINAAPVFDDEGRFAGSIEVAYDITRRKKMEEALRQSEEKFRTLFESATDAIFILDMEGRFIDVNRTAYERLGYTREEMMSLDISRFDPPGSASKGSERIAHLAAHGNAMFEAVHMKKDGSAMPVEINCKIIDYKGSKAIFSIIRDITVRKRVEERFRNLIETTSDWIWEVDKKGDYTYSSQKVRDILGYEPEEVLGKKPFDFMPPGEANRISLLFKTIVDSGQPFSCLENINLSKDGNLVVLETSGVPFFDAGGTLCGYRGIDRDITERRRAQEEIIKLNEALHRRAAELESAYKDMEGFSYAASHDLKAPVIRIAGFSDILSEDYADKLDEYGRECLARISDNADKMKKLIEDLLAFASFSAKGIRKSTIDMESLTRSVYEEIRPAEGERKIELHISALPSAYGDESLIRQVLLNLLTNAVKFTRMRETAVIGVGGRSEKDENTFYVRDNGTGFDMQHFDKLFGLFQRIHMSGEFEGTGIGLVIVKRIIEKHGGRVWAEGKPNQGATFYFTLPKSAVVRYSA